MEVLFVTDFDLISFAMGRLTFHSVVMVNIDGGGFINV